MEWKGTEVVMGLQEVHGTLGKAEENRAFKPWQAKADGGI